MGLIKINNIIYGSNNSADIIYKNTTVEQKLDSIPIFDPSDNANIEANQYDYLTYGHIVDTLESSSSDKVLSANQGRILKESIENIDFSPLEEGINNNTEDIVLLNEKIVGLNNDIESINNTCLKKIDTQKNTYIHYDVATLYPASHDNTGMIKIGLGLTYAMTNLYIDIWSYLYRGMIIAGGYTYTASQPWY